MVRWERYRTADRWGAQGTFRCARRRGRRRRGCSTPTPRHTIERRAASLRRCAVHSPPARCTSSPHSGPGATTCSGTRTSTGSASKLATSHRLLEERTSQHVLGRQRPAVLSCVAPRRCAPALVARSCSPSAAAGSASSLPPRPRRGLGGSVEVAPNGPRRRRQHTQQGTQSPVSETQPQRTSTAFSTLTTVQDWGP